VNLFNSSTVQFVITNSITIITNSITIILGCITLWLAIRQRNKMPSYEGISYEPINLSDVKIKMLLMHLQIPLNDKRIVFFHLLTFKLFNPHKEPLTFDEKEPLALGFHNLPILAYEHIESFPEDLDYTCRLDGGKLLLVLPRLERGESFTLRILVPGYTDTFPDIRIPGRAPRPMMKANNIRRSTEMLIMGIFYLIATLYMFFTLRSSPPYPLQYILWLFFATGLYLFMLSWVERKMPPSQERILPSTWFYLQLLLLIRALPVLLPLGIIAALIYWKFGLQILMDVYLLAACLLVSLGFWLLLYTGISAWFRKKKKKYNKLLIGFLTSIPSLAFLGLCAQVLFLLLFYH
jgi:hypothetical protein